MASAIQMAFKALADPTLRQIVRMLRMLRTEEMTAGDLAERFAMSKPSMSHHFSVLSLPDLSPRGATGRPSGTRSIRRW